MMMCKFVDIWFEKLVLIIWNYQIWYCLCRK